MKKILNYIFIAIGIVLLIAAAYFLFMNITINSMEQLPFVLIGIGCGLIGYGFGEVIQAKVIEEKPETAKQIEIERTDERNVKLTNMAKAKSYDIMIYLLSLILIVFTLLNVNATAILLLVAVYIIIIGTNLYYFSKFQKQL